MPAEMGMQGGITDFGAASGVQELLTRRGDAAYCRGEPSATAVRYSQQQTLFNKNVMKRFLHIFSLLLSLWLLATISADIFSDVDPLAAHTTYIVTCVLLLIDFFLLLSMAPDKGQFWRRYWPLFIVSLPLLLLADWIFDPIDPQLYHVLRILPLIRGFFSLYIIVGWWIHSIRGRMLLTYLFVSACVVYFSSLIFYNFEWGVNPVVHDYADALWWAAMNFTTIGSNIIAASLVGKILGVVMGFCGMMVLPVFTAFFIGVMAPARSDVPAGKEAGDGGQGAQDPASGKKISRQADEASGTLERNGEN